MKSAEIRKLLDLPVAERMELAQILWDSVGPADEAGLLAIPDWQRRILDERLADLERNPGGGQTWEEVKAEILSKT
jgi:putative addiction module component (TIGR02574 family)